MPDAISKLLAAKVKDNIRYVRDILDIHPPENYLDVPGMLQAVVARLEDENEEIRLKVLAIMALRKHSTLPDSAIAGISSILKHFAMPDFSEMQTDDHPPSAVVNAILSILKRSPKLATVTCNTHHHCK